MPFTEEVPDNFKPRCPCKRRGCPLQRYFVEVKLQGDNKRFFTYECSKPEVWASCNKTVNHFEVDPTKPQKEPEKPAPQPEKPKEPFKPTEKQQTTRCNLYSDGCFDCDPRNYEPCGIEPQYRRV